MLSVPIERHPQLASVGNRLNLLDREYSTFTQTVNWPKVNLYLRLEFLTPERRPEVSENRMTHISAASASRTAAYEVWQT